MFEKYDNYGFDGIDGILKGYNIEGDINGKYLNEGDIDLDSMYYFKDMLYTSNNKPKDTPEQIKMKNRQVKIDELLDDDRS
jgi:hypothetical protein